MRETFNGNSTVLPSRKQRWKRWATRKWLFPAIYMTAAVAVLSVMWFYDSQNQMQPVNQTTAMQPPHIPVWENGENVPTTVEQTVSVEKEVFQWPVTDREVINVSLPYYQANAVEPAMVMYEDTVRAHVGVDFARADQKAFDVIAAASGTVKHVVNDPLAGTAIELVHDGGISTIYQSVSDVKVKEGQLVKQGDLLAKSGRSELEKKQGMHMHFEMRKNGEVVNPEKEIDS